MSKFGFNNSARQKGFTLIEMSIVLVIIGLIIGGILKGQEVIESSRQKNLITQLDATRSALTTFVERYQALPGDFAQAAGAAAVARISTDATFINGDGDGIVEPVAAAATAASILAVNAGTAAAAGFENTQFWVHLFGARLIDGVTPSAAASTTFGQGSATPAVSIPGAGVTLAYGSYADFANDTRTSHWLRVHKGTPGAPAAGLTPKQMYQIDVKIDDGIPSRGGARSDLTNAECGTNAGTLNYQAANENVLCVLYVDAGG